MRQLTSETANAVGQMLWAENVRSVNHRYAKEGWEEIYEFSPSQISGEPVAILKAIDCYEYQSCEHPEWFTSEAFEFCRSLRSLMIGDVQVDKPGWVCQT